MNPLKVIFFGTPEFSVDSLRELHENPLTEVVGVVSMPDRPAGRGKKLQSPPVAQYAKEHNLKLYQVENINKEYDLLSLWEKEGVDFYLVVAFAQFLGSKVLSLPRLGAFNIHTSLLPKYRGAAPIQYALLNGDESTGVSIQRMVKKMDAGDIAHLRMVSIDKDENAGELFSKLQKEAALALKEFLKKLSHEEITYQPQDEAQVSFAPTIHKKDGLIDFENLSYTELYNKLRAYTPWPGLFFFMNNQRIKVHTIERGIQKLGPKEVSVKNNSLEIGLKDSSVRLKVIQLEGKRPTEDHLVLQGLKQKFSEFYLTNESP